MSSIDAQTRNGLRLVADILLAGFPEQTREEIIDSFLAEYEAAEEESRKDTPENREEFKAVGRELYGEEYTEEELDILVNAYISGKSPEETSSLIREHRGLIPNPTPEQAWQELDSEEKIAIIQLRYHFPTLPSDEQAALVGPYLQAKRDMRARGQECQCPGCQMGRGLETYLADNPRATLDETNEQAQLLLMGQQLEHLPRC